MTTKHMRVGTRVRSKAIGSRTQFVGVIVGRFKNYKNQYYYHVRDRGGMIWHRDTGDLVAVTRRGNDRDPNGQRHAQ